MIDFKIVKGGFYKARDGRKVECLKDDLVGNFPFLFSTDYATWLTSKDCCCGVVKSENDIVGVWEEPKPKRLCYRHVDDCSILMLNEKEFEYRYDKSKIERYPCALDEL